MSAGGTFLAEQAHPAPYRCTPSAFRYRQKWQDLQGKAGKTNSDDTASTMMRGVIVFFLTALFAGRNTTRFEFKEQSEKYRLIHVDIESKVLK